MNQLRIVLLLCIACLSQHSLFAQQREADSTWFVTNYTKKEVYIKMRDGKKLFTAIYIPNDKKEKHPILINRTPYSIGPYGTAFKTYWTTYLMAYVRKNYIIVCQDVRGRYMSEGEYMDVRPYNPHKGPKDIDEASDTYDMVDWLINNVKGNNGRVGVWGISYPGFYATMAALSGHPAIKAVSPQAPVTEWFIGDDFHHNGAFMQMDAFYFYSSFGKPRPAPTTTGASGFQYYTKDNYNFYLNVGSLADLRRLTGDSLKFWNELYDHPDYDRFWQVRNTRKWVGHIPSGVATLVVGGLFDAEDCFGAWNLYKAIEEKADNNNKLVMGPWSHGGWGRGNGDCLGNIRFRYKNSEWYQQHIEIPFFEYYLRGQGSIAEIKEANIFISGTNEWKTFSQWPPVGKKNTPIYLVADGGLSYSAPSATDVYKKYTSDPAKPVPYAELVHPGRTNEYMTDDQRFAGRRPDVLVYQTDSLAADVTLAGPVIADLYTSLSTTDADFVVKLIDVFPDNFTYNDSVDGKGNGKTYPIGGYQMLVRGEIMRGRYRNSFEKPEAFIPGKVTEVKYKLPDVAHTFKKGHRIMVQVQSTWFPIADRNPQQFVNIYTCSKNDFVPCDIRIYSSKEYPSAIILPVLSDK